MEGIQNIKLNINSGVVGLKTEWRKIHDCWDDTKSESYKTEYIIPILSSCSNVNKEIEDLNLAIKRLENLGVKI